MLEQVGLLDDRFFMYYEDTDLSWRARLAGWKVVYAPKAVIPHIHCGTTEEWSSFFLFYTDRNRLAMVLKNGSSSQVANVWGGYIFGVLRMGYELLRGLIRRDRKLRALAGRLRISLQVIGSLLLWLPVLFRDRYQIHHRAKVKSSQIDMWFLDVE